MRPHFLVHTAVLDLAEPSRHLGLHQAHDRPSLLARLNHRRVWVIDNLLAAADALTDDQLRRTFAIGQRSAWKSLVHMYAAEYVWLAALEGDDDPCRRGAPQAPCGLLGSRCT
jgi:hypothetical protein